MSRECSICGQELADSPLAGPAHSRRHKREFEEICGRPAEHYDEVRDLLLEGTVPDDIDLESYEITKLDSERWSR